MMKCPKVEFIADYLNEELSVSDMRDFEQHVEGCAVCQATLNAERELDQLVRSIGNRSAPAEMHANVMSRISTAPLRNNIPDWLTALAFGLFLAFLGSFIGKWKAPDLDAGFSWLSESPLVAGILEWTGKLAELSLDGWFAVSNGSSGMLILNLLIAAVILFWGLWQMVRAMR